jgi:hypothetical protein
MAITPRLVGRWAVFVPLAILAFSSTATNAEANYGITAVYYQIDEAPPTKSDNAYPSCGSEIENNINRSWDGEPFAPCPDDMFMVHYTGFITVPAHETIQFWVAADDGGTMKIGTEEWGDWNDKGCSATESGVMTLPAQSALRLDGWFYENGGGTCFMLAWKIDDGGWEIVPDEAFTLGQPQINTTIATTTTMPIEITEAPTTTQQQPQPTEPSAQETTPPETSTTSVTTTTSTFVATTTTIEGATTTVPIEAPVTTTSVPQVIPTSNAEELLANAKSLSTEELQTAIAEIVDGGVTPDEAVALATSPEALNAMTEETAVEVFEALDIEELTDAEALLLVAVVQDAPVEVRQAFEKSIDVFAGATDTYVPIGSTVPVSTRRAVIAVTGLLAVSAASTTSGSRRR